MKHEVIDEAIAVNAMIFKTPTQIKRLVAMLLGFLSPHLKSGWLARLKTSAEHWIANAKKDRLIYEFTRDWQNQGFDVLLCPAFAMPACAPKNCSKIAPGNLYHVHKFLY